MARISSVSTKTLWGTHHYCAQNNFTFYRTCFSALYHINELGPWANFLAQSLCCKFVMFPYLQCTRFNMDTQFSIQKAIISEKRSTKVILKPHFLCKMCLYIHYSDDCYLCLLAVRRQPSCVVTFIHFTGCHDDTTAIAIICMHIVVHI